jgi:alkanesulfonate monooxygenase SsuD/methylene tetrahydromethanopterin reductase-like flavin-dependent oxidoreductase (luciferase family)
MKFGWLTLAHSPSPEHDAQAIFEQLEQATLAEELGFAAVWLTEHNFTGESVYADPILFSAALAMRTECIRMGFAVIQMALRHPVRLATQLSLLDNLTGGRLDIGVWPGHDLQ